ncbi:MAG: autotransporter outer membrane beta-barrel domain-containing protein [Candidatus Helarchaeales archaeon]
MPQQRTRIKGSRIYADVEINTDDSPTSDNPANQGYHWRIQIDGNADGTPDGGYVEINENEVEIGFNDGTNYIRIDAAGISSNPSFGGESNTASNQGTSGVGVFDAKVGVDLQFRNIDAGSNKISVSLDAANKEIDIDVNEGNISHNNLGGIGENDHHSRQHSITSTSDHTSGATPGQILKADANGLPVDATNTDAEVSDAVAKKHDQVHDITGADHTAAGLTAGHVIRATGATTFAWQQLQHSDLGGVGASDHHARYTDEEAQDAVGNILSDTSTIDFTYDDATPQITANVKASSIGDSHINWGTGAGEVSAADVPVDTTSFNNILGAGDSNVKTALETLDDHSLDDHAGTSLADPDADKIVFWDDSDSQFEFLDAGNGLTITGNSLNWSASLDDLSDVSLGSPSGGDVLTYNAGTGTWGESSLPAGAREFVHVRKNQTQSIATSTDTVIQFDSSDVEEADALGFHDPSSNNSRLTVPSGHGGLYLVTAVVNWETSLNAQTAIWLRKNGATSGVDAYISHDMRASTSVYDRGQCISTVLDLSAGDYIELYVWHNKGSNANVESIASASYRPTEIRMIKIADSAAS